VDGRADGDAAPFDDAAVDVGRDLADLLLRAEIADRLGQPLDLPAQAQRSGQELLGLDALAGGVVADPGRAVVLAAGLEVERLARAGQIIEHAAALGVGDLLVDPRGKLHPARLALGHGPIVPTRFHASCCYPD
jgi:hypothetical protein